MGLLGNGFRHNAVGRISTATTNLDGCNASTIPASYNLAAMRRNMLQGWAAFAPKASTPDGNRNPVAWLMPRKAGGMASHNATRMGLSASGLAVGGITTTGTSAITISVTPAVAYPLDDASPLRTAEASITFTVADAAGQLISSGSGSASLAISIANALMTASIDGAGTAAFAIATNAPVLGAEASGSGVASITFTVTPATAFPLNDSSPLREGSATMSFSGSLTPYAVGHMQGSTVDDTVLTADIIANAVWAAIAASNNTSGTMGAKLNTASSGGVDLNALADAVRDALAIELARIDTTISSRATVGDIFAAV